MASAAVLSRDNLTVWKAIATLFVSMGIDLEIRRHVMSAHLADLSRSAAQGRPAWRTWLPDALLAMLLAYAVGVVVSRRHYS
jgi:hypothetical protein